MIDKTLVMFVGDLKAYLSIPVTTVHRKMDSGRKSGLEINNRYLSLYRGDQIA